MDAMLVFPHQLFIIPRKNTKLIFIEDAHFFDRKIFFHKHKLLLHRASMQAYYDQLLGDKHYYNYPVDLNNLQSDLKKYDRILAYDPVDHDIKDTYNKFSIKWLDTPNFLTDIDTINHFFNAQSRYFMHDFYVFQRKRLDVLMDGEKPLGGQYSFDQENRRVLPNDVVIPKSLEFRFSKYIKEAAQWVDTHFPNNPGDTKTFDHPVTRDDALNQLNDFLAHKFTNFGPYQDALSARDPYLFHSNISSSLNIGLLSPKEIVEAALNQNVPLASKEGFIRQIIGWREFIRAVYMREGNSMKTKNHLSHQNRLSNHWYTDSIGLPIVDETLEKLRHYAYSHHIERLMVLGNIMLLLNIHPDDVYHFFMAMHIDAYDWVMVPNIYGMSQFACGPLMTTKPYFSGSNYLKKMGVENGEWAETWDALFYLFLKDHREIIQKNPRLRMLISHLNKKDQETLDHYQTLKTTLQSKALKE